MNEALEKHYCGNNSWNKFVTVLSGKWDSCCFKEELIYRLGGQVDIAKVCFHKFPRNIFKVIEEKSPSLCGLSIEDCCKDRALINRVREMLMRMPE